VPAQVSRAGRRRGHEGLQEHHRGRSLGIAGLLGREDLERGLHLAGYVPGRRGGDAVQTNLLRGSYPTPCSARTARQRSLDQPEAAQR